MVIFHDPAFLYENESITSENIPVSKKSHIPASNITLTKNIGVIGVRDV